MKLLKQLSVLGISFFLFACASSIERVDTQEVIDLSGRWNDTDSQLVSKAMIDDVLKQRWLSDYRAKNNNRPTVIVGTVRNRSHEHINTQTFTKDLERALINSGEVDFVASSEERSELREERKEQASHSSESTAKNAGEEIGADFMMTGSINSILDQYKKESVMYYQVNLELINIETNRKVWIGEKKIKKHIKNKKVTF